MFLTGKHELTPEAALPTCGATSRTIRVRRPDKHLQ